MKIAAVVILYYPDNNLIKRIESYFKQIDVLYIFDNSEKKRADTNEVFFENSKIRYFHDGENKGIAKRLNQAADLAIGDGCAFLLTMDQDSFFPEGMFNRYIKCISNYSDRDKTAMFGVEFINAPKDISCNATKVSELITSGSMLNLKVLDKIGNFDENLFIDFVDHEYCYRAILKGYFIIKFVSIFLQHEMGKAFRGRSLITFKRATRSFHSSSRLYYMVRNYFYVRSKYYSDFSLQIEAHKKSIITRIKNKLFYDNGRVEVLRLIFKAYADYKNKRMGKLRNYKNN